MTSSSSPPCLNSSSFSTAKLLTHAEERSLAAAIAGGDAEARDRLVRANLRLVMKIARDYRGRGIEFDDLVGEGNIGLLRAAVEFDPSFDVRFSTYASYWIKQAIRHALTNTAATIRLPAHIVTLLSKWKKAERRLGCELGETPSFDWIATSLGLTERRRMMIERALRSQRVAHEPADDKGQIARQESEAGAPTVVERSRLEEFQDIRSRMEGRLDERERRIISLRFGLDDGEPLTLKEVGQRIGVTREWVRKIEKRAVAKLRSEESNRVAAPARRPGLLGRAESKVAVATGDPADGPRIVVHSSSRGWSLPGCRPSSHSRSIESDAANIAPRP